MEADLLPPSGGELRSPDVVLYEYVSAATSHACSCAAEATLASVHIGVAAPSHSGAAPVSGPPTISELEGRHEESPGTGDRHEQAVAFRDAYMELLADSAPDELDSLRREEPPMDDDGLANLIEALEAGSESFSRDQRSLLAASFNGERSWWARGRFGHRAKLQSSDAWSVPYEDDDDGLGGEASSAAPGVPALVAKIGELHVRLQSAQPKAK